MQGLKAVPARAGYKDAKQFCRAIALDYPTFSKASNGHINLSVPDFQKVCTAANVCPNEVATVSDVDYGVIPTQGIPTIRKPDKRRKKASLRFRVLPNQRSQIDRDLKLLGFATIQSWGDFCIKHLHLQAEQKRRRINEP